jgi:hypothetical protein
MKTVLFLLCGDLAFRVAPVVALGASLLALVAVLVEVWR